jgi:hypothetical protein
MAFEKNPDDLGALWFKSGPKGDYMTGEINGVKVVCFPNTKKTKETQPDWRVLKSKPRDGERAAPREDMPPPTDDDFLG